MKIDFEIFNQKVLKNKDKYFSLLSKLKTQNPADLDIQFNKSHNLAFEKIDCLDCANCCKNLGPLIIQSDIKRIADFLNISTKDFLLNYIEMDEDGDFIFKSMPCPFLNLENNLCKIYEVRPKACSDYPHTNGKNLYKNLDITKKNLSICPAVAEILDDLMKIY